MSSEIISEKLLGGSHILLRCAAYTVVMFDISPFFHPSTADEAYLVLRDNKPLALVMVATNFDQPANYAVRHFDADVWAYFTGTRPTQIGECVISPDGNMWAQLEARGYSIVKILA